MRNLAERVGLPMNPQRRNFNSRLALETGELIRDRRGDDDSAAFHHAVSRAFFVDGADISDLQIIARCAADQGVDENDVRSAWASHAFAKAVDDSMRASFAAGVTGVPAFGWPGTRAVSGMMEPERIAAILRAASLAGR
jgi:predicted DsbA family dithiol-disulfide isomerase